MNPPEMHPLVIWAGVVAAVLAVVVTIVKNVKDAASPIAVWVSGYQERKIERQARIEAAARILNDARVETLSAQVAGLSAQMAGSAAQLDAAMAEIVSLRAELHAERSARDRVAALEAENAVLRTRLNGLGGGVV